MGHGGFSAVGIRTLSFELLTEENENLNEITSSQRRFIAEYDASLSLTSLNTFDAFPSIENTLWSQSYISGSSDVAVYYPGTAKLIGDTIYMAGDYWLSTYNENIDLVNLSRFYQIEKMGLDGTDYGFGKPLLNIGTFRSSEITDEYVYVFGSVGTSTLPGGGVLNGQQVGRFTLAGGEAEATFVYDNAGSAFGLGSVSKFHDGKLYISYIVSEEVPVQGFDGETAVIDIREADTFAPTMPRFKLPSPVSPACKRPFAIFEDGSFSYVGIDRQSGTDTTLYLFRYSSEQELLWRQGYILPGHTPIEIYPTEDGKLLLVCLFGESPGAEEVELRLYKVAPGGIISSATSLGHIQTPPAFHPNPFTDELRLPNPPDQPMRVEVIGINGQPHGRYEAQNGALQLGHLPAGIYLLRMSDAKSGTLLGVQRVVKAGG
ncbi:MAG: hypothetical protein GVY26_01215 [Bacteroidetes bacterium]|nr:hypothetical protein [Bacteroidota bacterium]